jgi:hemolysin-activating ACP:hemolysin acyltransferase
MSFPTFRHEVTAGSSEEVRPAIEQPEIEESPAPMPAEGHNPSNTTPQKNAQSIILNAFGSIVSVLLHSPNHRNMTVAAIEATIVPAVVTGQYSMVELTLKDKGVSKPVAFLTWGSFSDTIDSELQTSPETQFPEKPSDWKSGDIIWIVDAAGNGQYVAQMIAEQKKRAWQGKTVRIKMKNSDGTIVVRNLQTTENKTKV